jgi:hypothetical protein
MVYLGIGSRLHMVDPLGGAAVTEAVEVGSQITSTPLAVGDSLVVVGTASGTVTALPVRSGRGWSKELGPMTVRPAVKDNVLYAALSGGAILVLNATTGEPAGAGRQAVGPVTADLVVADDTLYAVCGETLCVFDLGAAAAEQVPLDAPTAGAVAVYSGSVSVGLANGSAAAYAAGLRDGLRPNDMTTLLRACQLADVLPLAAGSGRPHPPVPEDWQLVAAFPPVPGTTYFGTVVLFQLRRPSDDQQVLVVAFGLDVWQHVAGHDPAKSTLAPVPASIGGQNAPADARVTEAVLSDYTTVRQPLRQYAKFFWGNRIVVTGQGQAAPLAMLCALDLAVPKDGVRAPAVECTTFGAAAPGNEAFATWYTSRVTSARIVAAADTTIGSMPAAWAHPGPPVRVGDNELAALAEGSASRYAQVIAGVR